MKAEKNVLGGELRACSYAPLTGYFRDGCCATHDQDGVAHLVCVQVTEEFLEFSVATRQRSGHAAPGDALPRPASTATAGACTCCAGSRRGRRASAPRVVLEATHENVLKYVPLSALKRYALDLN